MGNSFDPSTDIPPTNFWIEPRLQLARRAFDAGELTESGRLVSDPSLKDAPAANWLKDIIGRMRQEYSCSPDDFLTQLRSAISDATLEDVQRWLGTGELQSRQIDGKTMIFRREPANLFKLCPEAIRRRQTPAPPARSRIEIIKRIIAEAKSTGRDLVMPVQHHLRYNLRVHGNIPEMKRGSILRVWLPMPQEYRQQKNVRLIATEPAGGQVAPNGVPHRTVYFEKRVDDPAVEQVFTAEYEFTTYAYCPQLDEAKMAEGNAKPQAAFMSEFTAERLPHIPITPAIRALAADITAGQTNPLAKARAIFKWIDDNIVYAFQEEYCLIPSIGQGVLAARRGDCGVQAMAFIMLARAAGIPARWQSGHRAGPEELRMHDWCEFYVEPWGWLPCDPSDGMQKSEDPEVRDFYLGHLDPYRMIVNLDYGRPLLPAKHSFRSEPVDFQRGEVEVDGRNLYFDKWEYDSVLKSVEKAE